MTDGATRDGEGALEAPPGAVAAPASLAPLWLDTLGRLAARAAHPVRNALNGATLNAEVVRSRSRREGPASALASYAGATAAQLEHAAAAVAALLALLRPDPSPLDAAATVRRVADLLREPAGGGTEIEIDSAASALVAGSSDVARLVIVRTLLDCVPPAAHARCGIHVDDAILLMLHGEAVIDTPWDPPLAELARTSGIARTSAEQGVTVRLPRAERAPGVR